MQLLATCPVSCIGWKCLRLCPWHPNGNSNQRHTFQRRANLLLQVVRGLLYAIVQLAVHYGILYDRPKYQRYRTRVMVTQRLMRAVFSTMTSRSLAAMTDETVLVRMASCVPQYVGYFVPAAAQALFCIVTSTLSYGFVGYSVIFVVAFYVRFALSLPLHVAMLPTLAHSAMRLAHVFSQPTLQPEVCRLAAWACFLASNPPDGCHPMAPWALAYSVRPRQS